MTSQCSGSAGWPGVPGPPGCGAVAAFIDAEEILSVIPSGAALVAIAVQSRVRPVLSDWKAVIPAGAPECAPAARKAPTRSASLLVIAKHYIDGRSCKCRY